MSEIAPKISVVIPMYNGKETILRALESVVGQGFRDFEVLVVDDGSTDHGGDEVDKIGDSRVRVLRQENKGVSAARNVGIEEARGEIVAFLDADDFWNDDFLEKIVGLSEEYPQCSVFATSYVIRDADGNVQEPLQRGFESLDSGFIFTNYFEAASVSTPPIIACAVAVKKEALDTIGGFPVGVASGEDLLTWARLFSKFEIAYLPIAGAVYSKETLSWKHDQRVPESRDEVGLGLREILDDSEVSEEKKIGLRRYIGLWKKIRASHFIALGNRRLALVTIAESLSHNPWNVKVWLYIPYVLLPSFMRDVLVGVVEKNVDQGRGRI